MTKYKWVFSLAGLAFRVEGPEHLLSTLENAWSHLQSKPDTQPWDLKIKTDQYPEIPNEQLFQAQPRCLDGICTLEVQGC